VAYEESIGTKMNDLDLCSEVISGHVIVLRSSYPLLVWYFLRSCSCLISGLEKRKRKNSNVKKLIYDYW